MTKKNPYECLKTDSLEDLNPVEAQSTWNVTESLDEQVTIMTSVLLDGSWVYGFVVYWSNGRTSTSPVSAQNGLFRSQREAKLYAIGFMLMYLDYFTPETKAALRRAEASLIQSELF